MTPLSGFTQGLVRLDSLRCYTPFELRAISNKLIDGVECGTLLNIANATIETQDTLIVSLQQTAIKQDDRYIKTNHLVNVCESEKVVIQKELKKYKRRLVWTKVGWATTSVLLIVLVVVALIL